MESIYGEIPFNNEVINFEDLSIEKAIELSQCINQHPYCQSISRHIFQNENEGLVFDLEVEVPQYPKFDIRNSERILILFDKTDKSIPEVYALRKNFPRTLHQNILNFEFPKSLCLYEQPYHELKLTWTSASLIEQIRNWLKLTAIGANHSNEQPMEPFLLGYEGNIILPFGINDKSPLFVNLTSKWNSNFNFIASHLPSIIPQSSNEKFHPFFFACTPQLHGIINTVSNSYNNLYDLLIKSGNNLSLFFKEKIQHIIENKEETILKSKPLLILEIPVKRKEESEEIRNDYYCFFFIDDTVENLGVKLNLISMDPNTKKYSCLLFSDVKKSDNNIPIALLKPHVSFNPKLGAILNNLPDSKNLNIMMVGAGALGSQIFLNLARMGFGKWSVIDDDLLLPHNLARHAFYNNVGFYKSKALSIQANVMLGSKDFSQGFVDNFISPENSEQIEKVILESDLILDCSASIAVARKLSAKNLEGKRCVSIFLNTTGTDLIVLAEDFNRVKRLDVLEMQYYRELITNPALGNHLSDDNGSFRYAAACRDISNRIPQDYIALHASIGTNFIKKITERKDSKIGIWQIQEETLDVTHFEIQSYPVRQQKLNEWDIIFDSYLESKLFEAREQKLPNETGGILIGAYDLERKKIYIVDTILSPKDSVEKPYAYYRGIEGLERKLEEISSKTISNLIYIGEWHSHPQNVSLSMSEDDKIHFNWVRNYFETMGLPPLTLIVGDGNYRIYNNS